VNSHDNPVVAQLRETDRMSHLAAMFEFPSYMDASRAKMKVIKDEQTQLRALWDIAKETQDAFTIFNKTLFREVNAEKMEDSGKRLHKSMRKEMSKKLRDCDVFRGLDQDIKNFLNTTPLIQALTHKSMRPRHWEKLMQATGVEFTPPYKNPVSH
jgi:dynein heavy chain, axonemal